MGGTPQKEKKKFGKNGIFHEKMNLSTSKFFWDNFRVKTVFQKIFEVGNFKFHENF